MPYLPSIDGAAQTFGSVLKNNLGQLLMYTAQSTMQGCEEHCRERWGDEHFEKILDLGGKIVHIEVQEIITSQVIDKDCKSMRIMADRSINSFRLGEFPSEERK